MFNQFQFLYKPLEKYDTLYLIPCDLFFIIILLELLSGISRIQYHPE